MLLRKTASRGRDSVPSRRRRIRSWRLRRAAPRLATFVIPLRPSCSGRLADQPSPALLLPADLAGLAGLAAALLPGVADALALVGLRLPCRADARGHLADELLVDADHREARRVLDLE